MCTLSKILSLITRTIIYPLSDSLNFYLTIDSTFIIALLYLISLSLV